MSFCVEKVQLEGSRGARIARGHGGKVTNKNWKDRVPTNLNKGRKDHGPNGRSREYDHAPLL